MKEYRRLVIGVVLVLIVANTVPAEEQPEKQAATLKIVTGVVMQDLSVRPIPKFKFVVVSVSTGKQVTEFTTGFDGLASVEVPPGHYFVKSIDPLELDKRRMSWEVPVAIPTADTYDLEISNDNATITRESGARLSSELQPEFFARIRESVFTIETEAGHGSGFLVDTNGLILTNQHVIEGSRYLAVKVSETEKYPARLIVEDENYDLAVLQVNPHCVAGREPLVPMGPDVVLRQGLKVVAVGSPLVTEGFVSTGIVSSIEEGVIYSDVNINAGNSGGPLVIPTGEVIGVNTFGVDRGTGPGISGIVRIHLAADLVLRAQQSEGESPPDELLPVEPDFEYPLEDVRNAPVVSFADLQFYYLDAGKFDLQFMTPAVIAGLEKAQREAATAGRKKRKSKKKNQSEQVDTYDPNSGIYDWERYAGRYEPIVTIQAIPEVKMTGGSWARAVLGGLAGASSTPTLRFKDDFMKMRLLRNGEEVTPICPGRVPQVGAGLVEDVAYFGSYKYRPEAFKPDALLVLEVYRESKPQDPKIIELSPTLVRRIALDFDSYFETMDVAQE